MSTLIPLSLNKVLQTRTYTVIVLGSEEKQFSIYVEPTVGHILQSYFSNSQKPRPDTFDFMDYNFLGLEIEVLRVVIEDLQNTTYFAKLLLLQEREGMKHYVELDARPSDSLIIALRHRAPIFCSQKVLEQTIPFED